MKKPQPFGKYLLLERINVGGMAEVFLAKGADAAAGSDRIVAIKKIIPTMVEDEEFITMFIDEARIAVQLNHPNIVQIEELGKQEEHYYIAMEYVSGRDLRILLDTLNKRNKALPLPLAAFVIEGICRGLDYAHRKKDGQGHDMNIVHRDVSPQNVLIAYDGTIKIIDFGIAKAQNRSQKTQAGILKGKFGYMSPEQVRGQAIDRRSDIFAVGVIFYEMLTGERLFVGESDFSTLEKVRNAEVQPPRNFNDQIPEEIEAIVLRSLTRDPADRYQWAGEMADALAHFLARESQAFGRQELAEYLDELFAPEIGREREKMARFGVAPPPDEATATAEAASSPSRQLPPRARSNSLPPSRPEPAVPVNTAEATQIYDSAAVAKAAAAAPTPGGEAGMEAATAQTIEMPAITGDRLPTSLEMPAAVAAEGQTVIRPESMFRPDAQPAAAPPEVPNYNATVIKPDPTSRRGSGMSGARAAAPPSEVPITDPGEEITNPPSSSREARPAPGEIPEPPMLGVKATRQASPALKAIVVGVGIGAVVVVALTALLRRGPAVDPATLVISPEPPEGAQVSVDGRPLVEAEQHTFVASALAAGPHLIEAHNKYGSRELKVAVRPGETKPVQLAMAAPPPPPPPAPSPPPALAVEPTPAPPAQGAPVTPPAVVEANAPAAPAAEEHSTAPAAAEAPQKLGLDLSAQPPSAAPIQIMIETDPKDAEIFVDHESVGHGAYVLNSSDPSHLYHLKAVAPGRHPAEKTSRFAEGELVTLILKEAAEDHSGAAAGGTTHHRVGHGPMGTLILASHPVAKVFVDGHPTGRYTPIAPSDPLEISGGDHLIHFESDDGKKADRQINIQPHKQNKITDVVLN